MNVRAARTTINRERFMNTIKEKHVTIAQLARLDSIRRDASGLRKYLREEALPISLLDTICKEIDVDPFYLSADFDALLEQNEPNAARRAVMASRLRAADFPYSKKLKRDSAPGAFLKLLLLDHDITAEFYDALSYEQKIALYLELDRECSKILHRYFPSAVHREDNQRKREFEIVLDEEGNETIEEIG